MKKGEITNYEELKEFATKNYNKGGSQFVECWDQTTIDFFKKEGCPLTWKTVYSLMNIEQEEFAAAEHD